MDRYESQGKVCSGSEEEMDYLRRGPWTVEEDLTLINYVAHHGEGRWNSLARCAGLNRTGKSCRLRWLNYLRPDVRRGNITLEEQLLILELHSRWGNRWSKIAQHLPGRTDNEIKNYWRTRVQKHAKQLKCDVNSKQFKDAMRYLWMPRLVERIQATRGQTQAAEATTSFPDPDYSTTTTTTEFDTYSSPSLANDGVAVLSSDSFGTPVSDLTDCYNNIYPAVNQGNDQDYIYGADQTLISPTGYFNTGMDFLGQNSQWMDGGDMSDELWNDIDDLWFLHQ